MNVRWRLSVLAAELGLLVAGVYFAEGKLVFTTWFVALLIPLIVNPQLLEPWYARPGDVLANSIFAGALVLATDWNVAVPGWIGYLVALGIAAFLSALSLLFGRSPKNTVRARIARAARQISMVASSRLIYSGVFFLALLEAWPTFGMRGWALASLWALLMFVGAVNWQSAWAAASSGPTPARAEAMVAPARLIVTAADLPPSGSAVKLSSGKTSASGVVITRIPRRSDFWGEIHVSNSAACESLLTAGTMDLATVHEVVEQIAGSVDVGSTERLLRFISPAPIEVGCVVRVPIGTQSAGLYQVSSEALEESNARGGSQLSIRVTAQQIGVQSQGVLRLTRYRSVPPPGGPVFVVDPQSTFPESTDVDDFLLGHVVGTSLPLYLNVPLLTEGHLAIVGMTKMGKTSFAIRLARALAETRPVVVLDQTGEYRTKLGVPKMNSEAQWKKSGIAVCEPKIGTNPAEFAYEFLKRTVEIAVDEYEKGAPTPRVLIVDEAHQFVPEPAGMGFGSTGREEAMKFGTLTMQVRKYGISIILISQRTAVVGKSALSQCENVIAFRSVDQTGLDYLEAIAGGDVRNQLPTLRQGEALAVGPAVSAENPVVIAVVHSVQPTPHGPESGQPANEARVSDTAEEESRTSEPSQTEVGDEIDE